jgi:uncharacterized repeat protein (TIGR04042 family)
MPEMTFAIRWPDGFEETCYSPSLVVREHLSVGESYATADFIARCRTALTIASDRVEAKYGFPCSRARGQLARLEAAAAPHLATPGGRVAVLAFHD